METIKNLTHIVAFCFAISFFDGVFGWGLADGFYVFIGLIMLVAIIWLEVALSKTK